MHDEPTQMVKTADRQAAALREATSELRAVSGSARKRREAVVIILERTLHKLYLILSPRS